MGVLSLVILFSLKNDFKGGKIDESAEFTQRCFMR